MSDLSFDERRQILIELMGENSQVVASRHGISMNTLQHIRFYHGPNSSAAKRGYYHKDLIGDYIPPEIEKLKNLKANGMTSGDAAEETGIPLERVNKMWITL